MQESQKCIMLLIATNDDNFLHNLKVVPRYCYCRFNFAFCYVIIACPNHVEVNPKAASFDKVAIVSLATTNRYIYMFGYKWTSLCVCMYN